MSGTTPDAQTIIARLRRPERLWTRDEVHVRPSPVPAVPGVYGWHFTSAPHESLDGGRLLYVGVAPRQIRGPVRQHFRGNAAGSTLRLTLGCLLGLELRQVGVAGQRVLLRRRAGGHLLQDRVLQMRSTLNPVTTTSPIDSDPIRADAD
ncbi:GIY-YIG nuclease family protein [Actinokineospora iranica]|uniref:GIY-YIG catalytic domain-containing protein n=1 Tax=Actinokineospora iranica TaxID=1271860 RepID=A0A1G6J3I3_9PSEU|nr:hypothetical protein [Actinokineospora iranica]SDC13281.1 hypothetical protein SAMN05216174_101219 [Actinokineospora iranica]